MKIKELLEGIHDPHNNKAIFLVGGPGSGKSEILKGLGLIQSGMRLVNLDSFFDILADKYKVPKDFNLMPPHVSSKIRGHARHLARKKWSMHMGNHMGIVVDGTGRDPWYVIDWKNEAEEVGYDTACLYVKTSLPVATQRVQNRTDRKMPPTVISGIHSQVHKGLTTLQNEFGNDFYVFDNEYNLDSPETADEFERVGKLLANFLNR